MLSSSFHNIGFFIRNTKHSDYLPPEISYRNFTKLLISVFCLKLLCLVSGGIEETA